MCITDIDKLFEDKPYLKVMGARTIAKRFKVDYNSILEYRNKSKTEKSKNLRILIFDLETSPLRAYVWSRWRQNVYLDQTIAEWFLISWSAKWLGEKEVYSNVLTPQEILNEDDGRIVKNLWKLLDEADIVIAHNGKKFDIPKINARFILNECPPPSFYKQIDTKEVAAKQFGFSSNKLDALAGYFGIRHKDDTDFDLWVRCLNGEQEALNYMEKYNRGDVVILEKVYLKLRPWINSHPNLNVYMDDGVNKCISCGSTDITEDSFYYTNRNKFKTYRCNCCGALSRETKGELKHKILVPIPK